MFFHSNSVILYSTHFKNMNQLCFIFDNNNLLHGRCNFIKKEHELYLEEGNHVYTDQGHTEEFQ